MTDSNNKKRLSTIQAGLIGAAAGAAVGSTVAATLSDEKNRKKALETIDTFRKKAGDFVQEMNKKSKDTRKVVKKIDDKIKDTKKAVETGTK